MADTETFEHYAVLKHPDGTLWELGRGAMGVTYKAFDTSLRCNVALKVINATYLDSDMAQQRFVREARAAAGLSHPNVASVFHLGQSGENYFYAMEFIQGETLEAFVRRRGPLPAVLALRITLQVARALRAASREGLVHRDIKPANLMLVHDKDDDEEETSDEELHVKVIDFGLAKVTRKEGGAEASATITVAGFVGTPHFASPEQLEEKDLDVRSDIYSLGITLWYMLTGKPPFGGSLVQVMSQHLTRTPPFEKLNEQPPEVLRLLEHLLEKDPAMRPQTASELRREIEQIIHTLNARQSSAMSASSAAAAALGAETTYPTEALTSEDALASDQPLTARMPETGVVLAARFRLLQQISQSPRGTLFQAMELDSGRAVALRILPPELLPDANAFAHLEQEVERAKKVPHPDLLQIFTLERTGTHTFLTYEWVNGFPAVELLRHRQKLSPTETLMLIEPLAAAADHARQSGLAQLDYSLAQVLLAFELALDLPTRTSLLGAPLSAWPLFYPKLFPLSLTPEAGSSATWMGQQTVVPAPTTMPSALRQLARLTYELLGGTPPTAGTAMRLPPLSVLSERANVVLRDAQGEQGAEVFSSVSQFTQALRDSLGSAEPMGRSAQGVSAAVAVAPQPAKPATSVAPPPPLPSAVVPVTPPPLPIARPATPTPPPPPTPTPAPRGPLVPALVLLCVFLAVVAVLGGLSFFAWRAFINQGSSIQIQTRLQPHPFPSPTPVIIASTTPSPQFTPAPTVPPREVPTATPRPSATPALREARLRLALIEAKRLDDSGATTDAFIAYVRLAQEFPEADQGLSRVDSFVTSLRMQPLAAELEQRRFQQLRPALESAANLGSDQAMLFLGDHLTVNEPSKAVDWYRKAAEKDRPEAMLALGDMAFRASVPSLQPNEAASWYQRASDKGFAKAKVYLAECFESAKGGVERDYDRSFRLLNEALSLEPNNATAMEKLALAYERGHGTTPNTRRALDLMKQSADLGNVNAVANLGVYYMKGLGSNRPNPRAAVALFKQGADKNNAACMFFYAQCLESGDGGVTINVAEATNLYRVSAERGFLPARQWCQAHRVNF